MALIDVKHYYMNMLRQYTEMKIDMEDFEKGIEEGYITEDQLEAAREDLEVVKNNLDRLTYVMYLFNIPRRKAKKAKYHKSNAGIEGYFESVSATEKDVIDENDNVIAHFKKELEKLTK